MRYIVDNVEGIHYNELIEYAFRTSDYFMLVYCSYGRPFKKKVKEIKEKLKPYLVKKRHNSVWPGTESYSDRKYKFDICFYKTDINVISTILQAESLLKWEYPQYPEDICFFRKNKCWLFTVAHEEIIGVVNETVEDLSFLKTIHVTTESSTNDSAWEFTEEGLE